MEDWREWLAKLVAARGTKLFPLLVFDVASSTGAAWPATLPSCQGLLDFYSLCNGGPLSCQYNWLPLDQVEAETEKWRESLDDYHGDGEPVLLPGRHVVLASDSGGAPVIWDATDDRMASFFWKGGDWEPFHLGFEAFMAALFFHPETVAADGMWDEALEQLRHLDEPGNRVDQKPH